MPQKNSPSFFISKFQGNSINSIPEIISNLAFLNIYGIKNVKIQSLQTVFLKEVLTHTV
jgi:hypothetical protein